MNVLVTGAAGFIGSHLCNHLSSCHVVHGLYYDRPPPPAVWNPIQGDIMDYGRMIEIIVNREIDQVYHLAARSIVRNCCRDPLGCFTTNTLGTAVVLEACRLSDRIQGVMCMESDKSYGSGPVPYCEEQALEPTGVYEASKAAAGHVAKSYHGNYDLPVFTIRAANVYGPSDPNQSRLIPNTINRLRRGETPQITPGADAFRREFIHVNDFTHTTEQLMGVGPWGEAVNVGTGETATVSEIVGMICETMGKPMAASEWQESGHLTEIAEQQVDLTKLHRLLPDLREPITLEKGLRGLCST